MQSSRPEPKPLSPHSLEDVKLGGGGRGALGQDGVRKLGIKLLGGFPETGAGFRFQAPFSSPSGLSTQQEEREHFHKLCRFCLAFSLPVKESG